MSPKKTPKSKSAIAAALAAFLATAGITGIVVTAEDSPSGPPTPSSRPTEPSPSPTSSLVREGPYDVVRVVDGDTVHVDMNGTRRTLRLIGIDTPETVHPRMDVECYGPEASAEAKRVLEGEEVYVLTDPSQGNEEGEDHYGRLLSYIELDDGTDFAEHMLLGGFGEEYLYDDPYERHDDYVAAEDLAQEANLGMWAYCS